MKKYIDMRYICEPELSKKNTIFLRSVGKHFPRFQNFVGDISKNVGDSKEKIRRLSKNDGLFMRLDVSN